MIRELKWVSLLAAGVLTFAGAAFAMGSGGSGGGMEAPSVSAPSYDPAEEYAKGLDALQAAKYRDAARFFQRAADGAPRDANAWFMLGVAKTGIPDLRGAQRAYEKALKLDDNSVAARRELAVTLAKLGQADKAQAQLAILKTRLAACAGTCPQAAELTAAVATVEAALAPPASPAAFAAPPPLMFASAEEGDQAYLRAVGLINERRFEEALAALDEAQKAFGPHPDIITYRGYVWRRLGRYDLAETFYLQALAIAPNHLGATEYYGELKVIEGDLSGARLLLGRLDALCAYGCPEAIELRRWIERGGDPAA